MRAGLRCCRELLPAKPLHGQGVKPRWARRKRRTLREREWARRETADRPDRRGQAPIREEGDDKDVAGGRAMVARVTDVTRAISIPPRRGGCARMAFVPCSW